MKLCTSIVLFLLCFCPVSCALHTCFDPGAKGTSAVVSLQKVLDKALNGNYQLTVSARDVLKSISSSVVELRMNDKIGSVRWRPEGDKVVKEQWINKTDGLLYINSSSNCNKTLTFGNTTGYPLNPPQLEEIVAAVGDKGRPWTDIKDLINLAKTWPQTMWVEPKKGNKSVTIRGIEIDEWVGCANQTDKATYMEIRVLISKDGQKVLYPNLVNVPLQIKVAIFSGNKEKSTDSYRYEYDIVDIKGDPCVYAQEKYLLPPAGVVCQNVNNTKSKMIPTVADAFSMSLQYIDNDGKRLDSANVDYCKNDSLFGFNYKESDKDEPFSSGLGLKDEQRVVHDFKTGLQYASTSNYKSCALSKIPLNASDAMPGVGKNETRRIMMKPAFDILFKNKNETFVYVGQRISGSGVVCDVWISPDSDKGVSLVREAWFIADGWSQDGHTDKKLHNVPYQLVTYKKNPTGVYKQSTQRYTFDEDLGDNDMFPIMTWFVKPCLNMTNSSYLMVKANEVGAFDDRAFKTKLHRLLAQIMKISVLRISRLFVHKDFDSSDSNSAVLFLQISDAPEIEGTPTVGQMAKVSVEQAIKTLNDTINSGDLVIDKTKLNKGSLVSMTDKYHPSSGPIVFNKSGYTSGSMAVLAFFMLFMGGAVGVGGAYFMWKRNRGIAYQVYE